MVSGLIAAHRRRSAVRAAASPSGQLPLHRVSVVSLLLARPALLGPVEFDVGPSGVALRDDELSDPVRPDPESPDIEAGVLLPVLRQGM